MTKRAISRQSKAGWEITTPFERNPGVKTRVSYTAITALGQQFVWALAVSDFDEHRPLQRVAG